MTEPSQSCTVNMESKDHYKLELWVNSQRIPPYPTTNDLPWIISLDILLTGMHVVSIMGYKNSSLPVTELSLNEFLISLENNSCLIHYNIWKHSKIIYTSRYIQLTVSAIIYLFIVTWVGFKHTQSCLSLDFIQPNNRFDPHNNIVWFSCCYQ